MTSETLVTGQDGLTVSAERPGPERILFAIKTRGPQTVADLGRRFAISGEAVRQQLQRASEEGLVVPELRSGGVGRPAQLWRLTQAGEARFPDTHADLTVQLIDALKEEFGRDGLERVIRNREASARIVYGDALAGVTGLGERLAALAAVRTREGYMAEVMSEPDGSFLLVENHCPICVAARACQGFCRSELDLFMSAIGPDAEVERVDHIMTGARRCAYRVRGTQQRPAA